MKPHRLYIIMCILSLLTFAGCRDEEPVQSAEGKRTITVNLGIAMSRVAKEDQVVYGDANDMKVWLFDQTGRCVQYIPVKDPQFTGRDITGDPVESVSTEFDVTDVESLQFRVLLNTDGLEDENGNPLVLGGETTIDGIDGLTFQFGTTMPDGDNKVPMYGKEKESITIDNKREYNVDIELVRAVGKLELFFTKENENSELMIKKVTLTKLPDKGYLVKPETYSLNYSDDPRTLFESEEEKGTEITAVLTETDASLGDFSQYQDDASKLQSLMSAYLLENPDGGKWAGTEDDGNLDYTYPENLTNVTDNRYVMTVNYSIGGTDKMQVVYLPAIERNVWNKIFARVKDDGKLAIQYKVLKWEEVETSKVGYAPQPAPTNDCPFDDAGYTDFINGNYYILLPLKAYANNQSTKDLFHDLYMNPKEGDNEARLCILTRPTYDDEIDNNQHWALKTGSAGARYYFMLTGPEGATWEARLSNKKDFAFSISNTSDFSGNSDGYASSVRKVTHGIARSKPYIIEVIATHLYTGYKTGMTGQPEQDVEPRFDDGFEDFELNDPDDWKEYFDDTYLTAWGKAQEAAHQVAETDFYIVVKLQDGSEYELTINPSYLDYDKISANNFAFQNKRRYAGTGTRIKIRHVRAEHNIANLEELAKHEEGNWRKDNPDWNSDYTWN